MIKNWKHVESGIIRFQIENGNLSYDCEIDRHGELEIETYKDGVMVLIEMEDLVEISDRYRKIVEEETI